MGNELARTMPSELAALKQVARDLCESGFFDDARDATQAYVKILAGRELGIGPVASMTGIYVVKGKIMLGSHVLAALVRSSERYDYRVTELTAKSCSIDFTMNGEVIGVSTFTQEDAKLAGLDKPSARGAASNYVKYPRNMLWSRAMSNGVRWFCPDLFNGPAYTPEEFPELEPLTAVIDEPAEVLRDVGVIDIKPADGSGDALASEVIDGEVVELDAEPVERPSEPAQATNEESGGDGVREHFLGTTRALDILDHVAIKLLDLDDEAKCTKVIANAISRAVSKKTSKEVMTDAWNAAGLDLTSKAAPTSGQAKAFIYEAAAALAGA